MKKLPEFPPLQNDRRVVEAHYEALGQIYAATAGQQPPSYDAWLKGLPANSPHFVPNPAVLVRDGGNLTDVEILGETLRNDILRLSDFTTAVIAYYQT